MARPIVYITRNEIEGGEYCDFIFISHFLQRLRCLRWLSFKEMRFFANLNMQNSILNSLIKNQLENIKLIVKHYEQLFFP